MKKSAFALALLATAMAVPAAADGLKPGSVLVYPFQRSQTGPTGTGANYFTIINVTNTNTQPATPISLGGSTSIHFEYVNTDDSALPTEKHCSVIDRIEFLTPADTLSVLTNCHNASGGQEGYLVVTAQDPAAFNKAWSHNHLVGSELVVAGSGVIYYLNAIPFKAIADGGELTDEDGDLQLDFDGVEYEGISDSLYIDSFVADAFASLVLINMTGGFHHVANVGFDVWNDNEFPLSATYKFKCWSEGLLSDVSLVFSSSFLANNTPNDPNELDINCDSISSNNLETGWAHIRGLNASSSVESIQDPALLGAVSDGLFGFGGRRLWESDGVQTNGDFFKTGTDDPEN